MQDFWFNKKILFFNEKDYFSRNVFLLPVNKLILTVDVTTKSYCETSAAVLHGRFQNVPYVWIIYTSKYAVGAQVWKAPRLLLTAYTFRKSEKSYKETNVLLTVVYSFTQLIKICIAVGG